MVRRERGKGEGRRGRAADIVPEVSKRYYMGMDRQRVELMDCGLELYPFSGIQEKIWNPAVTRAYEKIILPKLRIIVTSRIS